MSVVPRPGDVVLYSPLSRSDGRIALWNGARLFDRGFGSWVLVEASPCILLSVVPQTYGDAALVVCSGVVGWQALTSFSVA